MNVRKHFGVFGTSYGLRLLAMIVSSVIGAAEQSSGVADAKNLYGAQFGFGIGEWETDASVAQDWNEVKLGLDAVCYSLNGRLLEEGLLEARREWFPTRIFDRSG